MRIQPRARLGRDRRRMKCRWQWLRRLGKRWPLRPWLGRTLFLAAMEIGRYQFVFDYLQQFRNAQLVHAGFVIVSLVAKRLVEALRQSHRDDSRRLVGLLLASALLTQSRQHLLNLVLQQLSKK